MATEEEIIRRRLLFDGDGTGDDKRLTTTLKMVVKWGMLECDEDERQPTYQRIMSQLSQCEYAIAKHHLAYEMNVAERHNYENLYGRIESQIEETRAEISTCKLELQRARVVRKNKQEYEALARVIETQPTRGDSERDIEATRTELNALNEERETLARKLELRQKQFHALIYSIQLLQQILEDGDDDDEAARSSADVSALDDAPMDAAAVGSSSAEGLDGGDMDDLEEAEEGRERYAAHASEKDSVRRDEIMKDEAEAETTGSPEVLDLTGS